MAYVLERAIQHVHVCIIQCICTCAYTYMRYNMHPVFFIDRIFFSPARMYDNAKCRRIERKKEKRKRSPWENSTWPVIWNPSCSLCGYLQTVTLRISLNNSWLLLTLRYVVFKYKAKIEKEEKGKIREVEAEVSKKYRDRRSPSAHCGML